MDDFSPDLDAIDEKKPWDRMENEPVMWFGRFDKYRLMGPKRSMAAVYRQTRRVRKTELKKNKGASNIPASWTEAARDWSWKARAEAWDEEQIRLERIEKETQIREEREGRAQSLIAFRRLLSRELQQMVNDPAKIREASLSQISTALETVFRLQREEFGEARSRIEVSGPDGGPMVSESTARIMPGELSNDTLYELYEKIKHKAEKAAL